MNRLDELGIPYKRLVRDGREVLLVPTIRYNNDECWGCVFHAQTVSRSCGVRWRVDGQGRSRGGDNHQDCMKGPGGDENPPGIYIDPGEIEEYLVQFTLCKLEGEGGDE